MNSKFKIISSLLTVFMLIFSLSVTVFAEGAVITFKGQKQGFTFASGSGYTASDLFDAFKDLMPGDILKETIRVKNDATDCDYIKLYMKAVVHDQKDNPLTYSEVFENADGKDQADIDGQRDETIITMQDFLSQLTMRIYNGSKLIYESSPDQAGGLTDNVFLGSIGSGEELALTVEIKVPDNLGNEYANRVGEVDWVFLAEAMDDEPDCDPEPENPTNKNDEKLIQTGQLYWPVPVLGGLGSLMALAGIIMILKKRKDSHV